MDIQTNTSLLKYNTFGINVLARYFTNINDHEQLSEIIRADQYKKTQKLVLGGGSNILFTKDYDGLVLKNNISGIEVIREDDAYVDIKVGAGENWHDFVTSCVKKNLGGLENLSLIPGNVGASPMQNIGAYGVEVKNLVQQVDFIDLTTGNSESLTASDCEFGYRTSVFKTSLKGQKFITHVHYRLNKNPKLNTSYGAIEEELERLGLEANVANISQAVINIRRSKLPDPKEIGNAGSFFKNPVIPRQQAEKLQERYPEIPVYKAGDQEMKVAAGWLIEKAGWKGKTIESYGVHKKQALVLVNYGGAKGSQINALSEDIQKSIQDQFGILLEKEVNIL